jgi:hypothetical protein
VLLLLLTARRALAQHVEQWVRLCVVVEVEVVLRERERGVFVLRVERQGTAERLHGLLGLVEVVGVDLTEQHQALALDALELVVLHLLMEGLGGREPVRRVDVDLAQRLERRQVTGVHV